MKEYKGLYHNENSKKKIYEHGAHFKYSDLFNVLKELQNETSSENNIQNKNNLNNKLFNKEKRKKQKKYKLKLITEENKNFANQRYFDYPNDKKNENKNNLIINDSFPKRINPISKSVDKTNINLPKIIINNRNNISFSVKKKSNISKKKKDIRVIDIINEKEYIDKINESLRNNYAEINKEERLPKINSFYFNQIEKEYEYDNKNNNIYEEEEKNQYKDNKIIKNENKNNLKLYTVKKFNNKKIHKIFLEDIDNNNNYENPKNKEMNINSRIRSIFEREKQIKINNNNDINDRIAFYEKDYINTINNDISQQIYNLKKNY